MYYLQIVNIVLLTFIAYQSASEEQKTGIALFGAQIQGSLAASVHVSMAFLGPVAPGRPIQIPPLVQLHENYTAPSSWPVFGPVLPISSLEHNTVTTVLDILPSNLCLSEAQPVTRSYTAISPPPTTSAFHPPPSDSPTPTTKLATTKSFANFKVLLITFIAGCFLIFCSRRVRPVLGIQVGRFIFFVGMVEATTEVVKVLARPRRPDVEKLGEDRDEDRAEVPANVPPPATPVADPITPPRRPPPVTPSTSQTPDTPMIDRVAALISSAAALARGQEEDESESDGLN
ncbi:hypothetical protein DFH07DRAFT_967328 [Mycena maculata]|uniref:Uncharacterized protein n=1 Tax=Mycena maculata TaxID=230809 RepID=A0AAD7MXH7_9AGAR|nr:hypothetical protein DFH07DRAFT_967328 [Mycena maculata]